MEAGAAAVTVLCRRAEPQVVQPYRWLTFAGFLRHLGDLDDAWRWRFMRAVLELREGFPQATWDRCAHHPGFRLLTGAPVRAARLEGDAVTLDTPTGPLTADFVIAGTASRSTSPPGPNSRPSRTTSPPGATANAAPPGQENPRLAVFPYLATTTPSPSANAG